MTCTLILHATSGMCPDCGRTVVAPGWNQRSAPGWYWCGNQSVIACSSSDGCISSEVAA